MNQELETQIRNTIKNMKARGYILRDDGNALLLRGQTIEHEALSLENDLEAFKARAEHTDIVAINGRWMVTSPARHDGAGWMLCEVNENGVCIQCWADISARGRAMRVFDAMVHLDLVEPV